jgi:hypothetical protein
MSFFVRWGRCRLKTGGTFLARVEDVVDSARAATARSRAWAPTLLSSRERERWRGMRHRGRRDEFLAARILVKYLWFAHGEPVCGAPDVPASGPAAALPVAHCVPRESLRAFLESALSSPPARRRCRWLQMLPGPGGAPGLHWRGRAVRELSVSVTHAGGWAAVAVAGEGRVGLDLERIETRSPSFADLFSPAERAWCAAQGGLPLHAALTLLWALREAALKAGVVGQGGARPFEVVPGVAAPQPLRGAERRSWALQPLPVTLPGGRAGLAHIFLDDDFVLARLALDPLVPDLPPSGGWSNIRSRTTAGMPATGEGVPR